ncbi:hypothetical protein SAMN04515674_101472 [Pseudarcicella hirudinis]|uniref:Uncharacterized protein n=1 Tax=Pseudarcicella hirudinis TaxID=1079859 RepID=A0A1I5MX17_9BACT|nr:hypothetical protein [Pseudarcicella hirudinis]SFP13676.1 hypothetical protein SAMN04515674_101472 [Pseudarcicella hirudinis]
MITDILTNSAGEILVNNGDIIIANGANQAIKSVITTRKGGNKFEPISGVGILDYVNSTTPTVALNRIVLGELNQVGINADLQAADIKTLLADEISS